MNATKYQSNWTRNAICAAWVLCGCMMTAVAAISPVACWDGDFSALSQNGVTIALGEGNAVAEGNSAIVIGATEGIRVGWEAGRQSTTIVVKYGNLSLPQSDCGVIATTLTPNGSCPTFGRPGVSIDSAGGIRGTWSTGPLDDTSGQEKAFSLGDGNGVLAYAYVLPKYDSGNSGTYLYQREDGTWSRTFYLQGLRDWDDSQVDACALGGPGDENMPGCVSLTGMRVEGIAVFDAVLTPTELAEFSFPSEASTFAVSLTASGSPYKWSTLAWQGGVAPASDTDDIAISVTGNVTLELDEGMKAVGSLSIKGSGELHLTGDGRLVAKGAMGRSAFSTTLPIVLSNGGDVYLPIMEFSNETAVEAGALGVVGAVTVAGDVTGTGALRLTSGRFSFTGSLQQTGGLVLGDAAMVVTENGSFGSCTLMGTGTVCFRKVLLDAATAENFRNAETWTGTCRLELLDVGIEAIDANKWGTESSKVCFAGVPTSYIQVGNVNLPEVVLEDVVENGVVVPALVVSGGWNRWPTTFRKLSGNGTFKEAQDSMVQYWYYVEDGNDFHGSIDVCNMSFSFGFQDFPPYVDNGWRCGRITVSTNAAMEIARGSTWSCPNPDVGVRVDGSLRCCTGEAFSSKVDVREGGVLEMYMTRAQNEDSGKPAEQWENVKEDARSYGWLTGLGVIRLTDDGTDYYRTMPAGMWASTLRLENCQGRSDVAGLLLRADGSATEENPTVTSVGTLSGSGNFITDTWPYEADTRVLEVTQRETTTWSGIIGGVNDRFYALRVLGDQETASRTLTITGTNTVHVNRLEVGTTGSVRLDGAWRGDIVVAGEFGGAGTQTEGAFAFSDGAVLNGSWGMFKAASVAAWPSVLEVRMDTLPKEKRVALLFCEAGLPNGLDAVSVSLGGALKSTNEFKLRVKGKALCLVRQSGLVVTVR